MSRRGFGFLTLGLMIACFGLASSVTAKGKSGLSGTFKSSYYKERPQFHMYPDEKSVKQTLKRVGPIGIGLELLQPAFTMRIMSVDTGSPADKAGLKTGQYIESINGVVLKDEDPRVILGNLITDVEAKDGIMTMMIKDAPKAEAKEVTVTIPTLGAYSDTWPMNCKKSDTIVANFSDFLAKHPRGWGSALFLLSTGEAKDLEVVRGWFSGKLNGGKQGMPWSIGYTGPAMCEYYLRTGDKSVLPAIEGMAEYLKTTIYNGSWMGRGGASYGYMGGGHMNAAGVHAVTFLLLAKECGATVDEHTLQSSLKHFYRYAGHSNVSYGDGLPEGGGVDNGKNGGLAFAMAAAASLSPDGEASVYAKARDINANKSFYTTSWLFHGHTGGGIGEIWRGAAMGLLAGKRPNAYRSFMDERRWMYELARTWDGAFAWSSTWNVSYDTTGHKGGKSWGNYVPLVYTIPRQKLRIFGAKPSQYSNHYAIPTQPWGNTADEAFYSLEGGEYQPGKKQDMSKERLPTHASWPTMARLDDPKITDAELLMFAHHPDSTSRGSAAGRINKHGRTHLIVPLLKSKDPRGRFTGIKAILDRKTAPSAEETPLLIGIINDPKESWWVERHAMLAIGLAAPEQIAQCYDRLAFWLKHDDWWLRQAAMQALTPLSVDKKYYKEILPIIGEMVATNERAVALSPLRGVVDALKTADPEIQQFGTKVLSKAYVTFPRDLFAPGGQDMSNGVEHLLKNIARNLSQAPGGFDALYDVSRDRFPGQALPHKALYLGANPEVFGPKVKEAFKPLVLNNLIPQYMGQGNHIASNKTYLRMEAASEKVKSNYYYREPRMAELVRLYQRIGIHDYDWRGFGPDLTEITWMYHSFDPPEEKLWSPGKRYREVTYPKGMENWFTLGFDAKAAGWKAGSAPFGQFGGKLVTKKDGDKSVVEMLGCKLSFCHCSDSMKTLWEKEVLLLQAKVKFPPFKEGHRYRLCVGGMSHVNGGDGYRVYVNGKLMRERKSGVGKREGGRFEGYYIDKEWWPDFQKDVTIAATGFLPIPGGKRSPGVKRQHFSIFLQEMKAPPLTDDMFQRGRTLQPMRSTTWQATKEDTDLYRYDGEFEKNPAVIGQWTQIGTVAMVDDFDPREKIPVDPKAPMQTVTFKADGATDNDNLAWSGSMVMDLEHMQALEITPKTIDGTDYVFIEVGGYSTKSKKTWKPDHPADWKPALYVMKRVK